MQTNEEPSAAPLPEEPQNRIQGVGETLRSTREAARVSLEQAGEELRIEPKFLAALEDERYEDIGIPVFAKGYLKLYCEYLGVDYRRLLPLYQEKAGQQAPPLKGRHSIERRETSGSGVWVVIGLAVVVLVLLAVWLLRDRLPAASETTSTTPAPLNTRTPDQSGAGGAPRAGSPAAQTPAPSVVGPSDVAAVPAVSAVPVAPASAAGGSPAAVETRSAADGPPAAIATPAVAPAVVAAAASDAARTSASEPAQSAADAASPPASAAAGPRLEIELKFVQDSWVEIKDSTETRLYYGTGKAGEESHLVGAPPLGVVIGNADGVVLEVDGEPYAFPRRRTGKVAAFTLKAPAE